jgi:hypothetical protein
MCVAEQAGMTCALIVSMVSFLDGDACPTVKGGDYVGTSGRFGDDILCMCRLPKIDRNLREKAKY